MLGLVDETACLVDDPERRHGGRGNGRENVVNVEDRKTTAFENEGAEVVRARTTVSKG